MGQKVHPTGMRLGLNKTWRSRWFASRDYADLLHEDLAQARPQEALLARGRLARGPGAGRQQAQGQHLHLRPADHWIAGGGTGGRTSSSRKCRERTVQRSLQHPGDPEAELDAQRKGWIGGAAAREAHRLPARHGKAVDAARVFGAKGIKARVSGRLNGAEIAGSEWYLHGQLPLHTLRADIDYGLAEADTPPARIGVNGSTRARRPSRRGRPGRAL